MIVFCGSRQLICFYNFDLKKTINSIGNWSAILQQQEWLLPRPSHVKYKSSLTHIWIEVNESEKKQANQLLKIMFETINNSDAISH